MAWMHSKEELVSVLIIEVSCSYIITVISVSSFLDISALVVGPKVCL